MKRNCSGLNANKKISQLRLEGDVVGRNGRKRMLILLLAIAATF
jgi:hypothetical protein